MIKLPDSLFFEKLLLDKKKLLLVVVVSATMVFLDVSFILKMQLASIAGVGPKITKLKSDLEKFNKDLEKAQSMKDKGSQEAKSAAAKYKKIISEGQISALLQSISEAAGKNNIRITQMKYAPEPKETKQVGGEKLTPYLISVELSSDYHTLGKFLNELENGEVFIAVQDLRITPGDQPAIKQSVLVTLKTNVRK